VRSAAEIQFRLRQEIANLLLRFSPPKLIQPPHPPVLPNPAPAIEHLRTNLFAAEIVRLADQIVAHRFPIFGEVIETGREVRWRRDYAHGVETGTPYFRRVPYLDFERVGDHKYIWELNRHQHLVILAQAYAFTCSPAYLEEIETQITSWLDANPYLCGINWASALEVAFRALSWVWVDHLAGAKFPTVFRQGWLTALYRHGCYLEQNLSVYFSPNTHLLGEAVVLHTLGTVYPDFPRAARWRRLGHELVEEQMRRQVRSDGAHFEQSAYYHVYALDFFLWHALLAETSPEYQDRLRRMAAYLDALLGRAGHLPLIGDDDGGRLFHPFGERDAFGRATLATCGAHLATPEWIRSETDLAEQAAWWLGASGVRPAGPRTRSPEVASQWFSDSGTAVMAAGDVHIVIKTGGFGPSTAGHSHSDVLSFVCRRGHEEFLIDPGTYTYLDNAGWRNRFRGSAAHNTIKIDNVDQATPSAPFRWQGRPVVTIRQWRSTDTRDWLDAECAYAGFVHRRRFLFLKPDALLVLDTVAGPPGDHLLEQFWHCGKGPTPNWLALSAAAEAVPDWRSQVYGSKKETITQRVVYRGSLPVHLAAAISFTESLEALTLSEGAAVRLQWSGGRNFSFTLSDWLDK